MTDSLSQYCPNCEAQANTIEELRAANERWAIAFKQVAAEERAKIVAWLRHKPDGTLEEQLLGYAIKRGEHETFTRSDDV